METSDLQFDQWCILEIMGHQRYAGRVTEQSIGGSSFLRIDIPATGGRNAFTKYFSAGSVYAITPVTKDIAEGVAAELNNEPISIWDLPAEMRQKLTAKEPAPALPDYLDDDDRYDDDDDGMDL